jgi:hypothetical protein
MDTNNYYKYVKYKKKYLDLYEYYKNKYLKVEKKYSFVVIINDEPIFKEFDTFEEYIKEFDKEKDKGNIPKDQPPIVD